MRSRPVLDLVLRKRAWDFVELLTAWGADPKGADPYTVLDTYQSSLMERFWDAGVDFTRHNRLADYLSTSTRNKPAYGWARRHNDDGRVAYQLALALGDAVFETAEKAALLLLWAGADPHRKVPSLRWGSGIDGDPEEEHESAVEVAVQLGHGNLLRHLKPDPGIDDFEELYAHVCDPETLEYLFDLQPPSDWSKTIVQTAGPLGWSYRGGWSSRRCLEHVFEHHWGQLSTLDLDGCQDLRRYLLKVESDSDHSWLLQKLAKPHHCDEAIFAELTRTPAIRRKMESLRLDKLLPKKTPKRKSKRKQDKAREDRPDRDQLQAWLNGLDPETKAEILRSLISREQLYDEVWAELVTKVAERYGVSDVAVAKWCRKMDIPRPGRGYWARKSAGQMVKGYHFRRSRKRTGSLSAAQNQARRSPRYRQRSRA